jgi:hypothetical protein
MEMVNSGHQFPPRESTPVYNEKYKGPNGLFSRPVIGPDVSSNNSGGSSGTASGASFLPPAFLSENHWADEQGTRSDSRWSVSPSSQCSCFCVMFQLASLIETLQTRYTFFLLSKSFRRGNIVAIKSLRQGIK